MDSDYDQWYDHYKPGDYITDFDDPRIKAADPNRLWTLVDTGAGTEVILPGFQRVNRLGYYICEAAFDLEHLPEEVPLDDD